MSPKISEAVITSVRLIAVRAVVWGGGKYSDGPWRYSFLSLVYLLEKTYTIDYITYYSTTVMYKIHSILTYYYFNTQPGNFCINKTNFLFLRIL